jgi:hypothetical protein
MTEPGLLLSFEECLTEKQEMQANTKSARTEYEPLPSVWFGEDADLLEKLLKFYPRTTPKRILDATINGGRFWRGSRRKVTGLDIDLSHHPTVVADNTQMPFRDRFFPSRCV